MILLVKKRILYFRTLIKSIQQIVFNIRFSNKYNNLLIFPNPVIVYFSTLINNRRFKEKSPLPDIFFIINCVLASSQQMKLWMI
uniref:Uncharacterized protein n=1 Tax=Heterorhabditis bacteriophora TaxID=37862 RepID=A0A1I7WTN5_HETBA